MDGRPVTIRLIDPPLHEFLPEVRRATLPGGPLHLPLETVALRVTQLHEANPMLGHRGCRVCLVYPEILDMQVRAIVRRPRRAAQGHPRASRDHASLIMDPKESSS